MSDIQFFSLDHIDPEHLLAIVNDDTLRKHLIEHQYYTADSIRKWVSEKLKINALKGCRIRAITIDGALAGWCGIQPDDNGFELAIVISQQYWGCGITVFITLMHWAKELGHKEIRCHLLDSRPEYKALKSIAHNVEKTALLGRDFTTYYIPVTE